MEFISEGLRSLWKKEVIRVFNQRLSEIDPQGKIGQIPEEEILDALRLSSSDVTREEVEIIIKDLWKSPWPSYEEADRTSIYPRVWNLLEKHKRPDI